MNREKRRSGHGAAVEVGVHQSTRSCSIRRSCTAIVKRSDDGGEHGVVDGTGEHRPEGIRDGERRAERTEGNEQDHRVPETENEHGTDRDDRAQSSERARQDRRATDTDQERERGRAKWSLCQDIKSESPNEGPDQSRFEHRPRSRGSRRGRARDVAAHLRCGGMELRTIRSGPSRPRRPQRVAGSSDGSCSSAISARRLRPPARYRSERPNRRRRLGGVSHGP